MLRLTTGHYAVPISRTKQLLDNIDSTVDSEKVFLTINDLPSKSSDEKKQNSKETEFPIKSFQQRDSNPQPLSS